MPKAPKGVVKSATYNVVLPKNKTRELSKSTNIVFEASWCSSLEIVQVVGRRKYRNRSRVPESTSEEDK